MLDEIDCQILVLLQDDGGWVCDDARIRAELGYHSRVGLAEGVAATLRWYRRQGWL